MNYVKMFGLAIVATMILTAFVGSSSASATVLCTTNITSGCAASGWDYSSSTTEHITESSHGVSFVWRSGPTIINTCKKSTIHKVTANTGSSTSTVSGNIDTLTWGTGAEPCTKTTDTLSPGSLEIHWISGTDNGTVTASDTEVTINTIFGTCVYGTAKSLDLGTLVGGTTPTISIDATLPKISGNFACPSQATFEAEYEVQTPHVVYISTS